MKRTYISTLAFLSGILCLAQSAGTTLSYMNDAYTWAQNEYFGTARSMGMGNAVTAVGGDLGMIGINPAGSAVAKYSQVSITPALSITASKAQGVAGDNGSIYLNNATNTANTRFALPNVGFTLKFDTHMLAGLKRVTIGFMSNTNQRFDDNVQGYGINPSGTSSIAGSLASAMTGVNQKDWSTLQQLAWDSMIVGTDSNLPGKYIGITEVPLTDGTAELEAPVNQRYSYKRYGSKNDYLINLGFNISDIVYFGANMGLVSLMYDFNDTFQEIARDPDMFHTGFNNLTTGYTYRLRGTGIYGKFGVIVAPVGGLRIGAAIETPTSFSLVENYTNEAYCSYQNTSKNNSSTVNNVTSGFTTPMRFNLGLAYTIASFAVISADYEMTDYSKTRFTAKHASDRVWFDNINNQIMGQGMYTVGSLGKSHSVRVGAEVKPLPFLALRAGWNLITDGSRFRDEAGNFLKANTQNFSAGLSWYSMGSFYTDLAFRYTKRPVATYQVYADYDNRGYGDTYRDIHGAALESKRPLMMVSATLGWRF